MKTPKSKLVSHRINAPKKKLPWHISLNFEQRCYTIGFLILFAAAALKTVSLFEVGLIANIGAVVFVLGLLPLIEATYEWLWRKLLGKLLIAALVALSTNMAYGVGRQLVASLVNTCPAQFSSTINIATILVSPLLVLIVLALGGVIILLIATYAGVLATIISTVSKAANKLSRAVVWFARFLALVVIVIWSWKLSSRSSSTYYDWVARRTAEYLYTFDMYQDDFYAKGKTEKVALLSDGRVLVGSKPENGTNIVFTIRQSLPNEHKDSTTESTRE